MTVTPPDPARAPSRDKGGWLSSGVASVGAESTVVANLLPEHLRSNGFGVLGLVQSVGDLGATMVTGILWSMFSATVAFLYAATWMILSVAASGWLRPPSQRPRQAAS